MRCMIIVKADENTEAGVLPSSEMIAAIGRYTEELIAAGALLAAEGLAASSKGARVKLNGTSHVVTDGPFAETRELIAGFWLIDVRSLDEAIAWAKKIPMHNGEEVEVRKVMEAADFPVNDLTEEHLKNEQAWRDKTQKAPAR